MCTGINIKDDLKPCSLADFINLSTFTMIYWPATPTPIFTHSTVHTNSRSPITFRNKCTKTVVPNARSLSVWMKSLKLKRVIPTWFLYQKGNIKQYIYHRWLETSGKYALGQAFCFFIIFLRGLFYFFTYCIQHCFICRPSDSPVPTDAGIRTQDRCNWCTGSQTL